MTKAKQRVAILLTAALTTAVLVVGFIGINIVIYAFLDEKPEVVSGELVTSAKMLNR